MPTLLQAHLQLFFNGRIFLWLQKSLQANAPRQRDGHCKLVTTGQRQTEAHDPLTYKD